MSQELSAQQQQALLELLRTELRAACQRALSEGVPPDELDALLDARAASLKAEREESADVSSEAAHPSENPPPPPAPSHPRRMHGPPCDGAPRRRTAKSG